MDGHWLLQLSATLRIPWFALFVVTLLSSAAPAFAATMEATPVGSGHGSIITVIGNLELGDEKKFIDLALGNPEAVVVLGSNGGNLVAGIEIGKAIRLKGYRTFVPDGATCASACALAWLGGQVRAMGEGAKIGFHAASFTTNGEVTSAGNALVGAYLNQLGLPTSAVIYISETPPGEIRWLTFVDAQTHGIDVKRLDLPKSAENTSPKPLSNPVVAPNAAPIQSSPPSLEDKAKYFVSSYFQKLSLDTNAAMQAIANSYAPTVTYYSKTVANTQIEREKLAFFNRWPVHQYAVEPSSLISSCSGVECQVSGTVTWKMYSAERGSSSYGNSSFLFHVKWFDGRPLVTLEESKVLSREKQEGRSAGFGGTSLTNSDAFPNALTGTILPPYCHMDYCSWKSIESRESVQQTRYGELFKLTVRGWSSFHPGGSYNIKTRRTGGGTWESYVFCSKTRPGVAFSSEGKWIAHTLAPDQSDGVYGYNSSDYTLYFAACYGLAVDETAFQTRAAALGYRTSSARANQINISGPADLTNIR
jgi:hypothetical protein